MSTVNPKKRSISDTVNAEEVFSKKIKYDNSDSSKEGQSLKKTGTDSSGANDEDQLLNKTGSHISSSIDVDPFLTEVRTDNSKENPGADVEETTDEPIKKKDDEETTKEPRKEAQKFPKLYRLLRDAEDISNGLTAKSPNENKSVAEHVATGSNRGFRSQYISTCAALHHAESFRSLKLKSGFKYGMKHIVEIDVGSLPHDVQIIDLRETSLRRKYEISDNDTNEKFHKFAQSHQEVLLVGHIPSSCLTLREFTGIVPVSDSEDSEDSLSFFGNSYFSNSSSDSDFW